MQIQELTVNTVALAASGLGYRMKQRLQQVIAMSCFAIGAVGIFMPLLPTTIFWILAMMLGAKSMPGLKARIYGHPRLGGVIEAFIDHGHITRRSKGIALAGMTAGLGLAVVLGLSGMPLVIAISAITVAAAYVVSRPEGLIIQQQHPVTSHLIEVSDKQSPKPKQSM